MKPIKLLSVVLLLSSVVFTSCRSSYPPPSRHYAQVRVYPLIIAPHPGFTMARHPNGRYYHTTRNGVLYWRGYDDRFYLDPSYVNRKRYPYYEYNEWKQKGRRGTIRRR